MKSLLKISVVTALLSMTACELFDPTDVVNPNLTENAILGTANPMISWIGGCDRQLALISNASVTITEIASDNYQNTRTFFNQNLDRLNILFTDIDMNTLQFAIHRLREMADYGLTTVAEADPTTTEDQLAKLHIYKGLSSLLSAEYFKALPGSPSGPLLSPAQHLQKAVDEFTTSLTLATDPVTIATATLARARAHYRAGSATNAVNDAQAAIAASPSFLLTVEFDATNAPTSTIQNALFDRGTFDDLQPLPRLDFLDPKSFFISASLESATPFLKIEEAHLIIAEAQLAQNNLAGAKTTLTNLLSVVAARPVVNVNDNVEGRTEAAPGSRPNNNAVQVAASATDPLRAGLVRTRNGAGVTVPVPTVSGTSVTAAMITALANEDEALEMLYLMRQEIFIAEGRRMTDMGIRLVVSEIEALANSNIPTGDASTISILPSFIDGIKTELDAFTYDANTNTCIITHNVNRILVQNKTASTVLPFH
ncbi:hypothetical protein SanaruYs_19440 [Chryseotalea sanaruensis]|uniref:Tetratricopeptide repeat protein n=1 Tax=Chryseotalea sanaruensis TaxID=2482724 RepID=A0A401UA06_9BACT|nr:hypothetical protein [Chryseotalea sanaruensis]GCC51715.1 hypothetical protein SanaruYs_19440 [Chryseotalea sanaruensis]